MTEGQKVASGSVLNSEIPACEVTGEEGAGVFSAPTWTGNLSAARRLNEKLHMDYVLQLLSFALIRIDCVVEVFANLHKKIQSNP